MSPTLTNTLLIALGGALGSVARYWIFLWTMPYSQNLPWGTILINIAGSFIIAFFGTLTLASGRIPLSDNIRLFVMVGICGGFTTFSSFSLQTLELLRMNLPERALINIVVSVIVCIAAAALGHAAATSINGPLPPVHDQ